jgi:hypothetical protein
MNLARPESFKLPTFWFVGRSAFFRVFQINNLDGPPSPYFTPKLAEARREPFQPYVALQVHPGSLQRGRILDQRIFHYPGEPGSERAKRRRNVFSARWTEPPRPTDRCRIGKPRGRSWPRCGPMRRLARDRCAGGGYCFLIALAQWTFRLTAGPTLARAAS